MNLKFLLISFFIFPITCFNNSVLVFVLDSGLDRGHPRFNSVKTYCIWDIYKINCTDDNGHGTHVSGLIVPINYTNPINFTLKLMVLKILNSEGNTKKSIVIDALTFILEKYKNNKVKKYINFSVKMNSESEIIRNLLLELIKNKFKIYMAAGNDNVNACYMPLGNITGVNYVGALDNEYSRAPFSNWGPCITHWAPGVAIYSSWPRYLGREYAYMSGTSMACPQVLRKSIFKTSDNTYKKLNILCKY